VKRKIVARVARYEESATLSARTFSWRATKVYTLDLECGHRVTFRNTAPKYRTTCKACARGAPVRKNLPPLVDKPQVVKNPIARALLPGGKNERA